MLNKKFKQEVKKMSYVKRKIIFPIKETKDPNGNNFNKSGQDEETILFYVDEGKCKGLMYEISPPYKCPSSYAIKKEELIKNGIKETEITEELIFKNSYTTTIYLNGVSIATFHNLNKQEALRKIDCGISNNCIWELIRGKAPSECGNMWCGECTIFTQRRG